MSYCLKCQRQVHSDDDVTAFDSRGTPIIKLWEPLFVLCPECYSAGWRLNMCGDIISLIQEHDEPEVSLLDLLTNEENK